MPKDAHANANLALLGDKRLMFNSDRTAFIMYQESGSSWVVMGDPVGRADQCESLAWDFLEYCDGMAVSPVFYQVAPDNLSLYIDLGMILIKLGEEARIALPSFSLEGRRPIGPAAGAAARGARRGRVRGRAARRACRPS